MAWTMTDFTTADRSTAQITVAWNSGQADEFVYTESINLKVSEAPGFVSRAKAAKAAAITSATTLSTLRSQVKTLLEEQLNK